MRSDVGERLLIQKIYDKTVPEGDCLRWAGGHTRKGYGSIDLDGRTRQVHRVAYQLLRGPIPDGLEIDHTCRVRDCIRIEHLDVVTHRENLRRAQRTAPTHCPHGHPYTDANTMFVARQGKPGKARVCRECKKLWNKKRVRGSKHAQA